MTRSLPMTVARRRARTMTAVALCAPALQTGCGAFDRPQGPGESVFEVFAPPTPQQAVVWAVDPYDADNRYRGLLLLANAPFGGEGPYVEMYRRAAEDIDPGVRAMAMRAFGMHGGPDDAPLIAERLTDEDEFVRWEAARALQRIHNPAAVTALIRRLDTQAEESTQVREAAARALGQYAEPRVVQALIGALSDRSLVVNAGARDSLRTLTGQEFGYDPRTWLAWSSQTGDLFASRQPYEYPVFQRDRKWWEWVIPFMEPPNEIAGAPAGAPPVVVEGARDSRSAEPRDGDEGRNG